MEKEGLYKKFAEYYDKIYFIKDYKKEANFIHKLIKKYKKNRGGNLLDVCCGTAEHEKYLKGYAIYGIDKNKEMIKIAKKKIKGAKFKVMEMRKIRLRKKFDVILCLFSSINYNKNREELKITLKSFYNHLNKGGLVIFDIGFTELTQSRIDVNTTKNEENIIRISKTELNKDKIIHKSLFLVEKGNKSFSFVDVHVLSKFKVQDIIKIMENLGFNVQIYGGFKFRKFKNSSRRPVIVGIK